MPSTLSTRQRTTLVSVLLVAGEASVVAGLFLGWSAAAVISASAACLVTAILVILSGSAAIHSFLAGLKSHTQRMAQGDLTLDIPAQESTTCSACSEALQSLQALQVALRQTLGSIRGGADGVSVAAREIATGNADLSNRTEQTATNLQRAASSMAQLTGTVNQTADSARTANQLARSASEVAARGGNVVAQVVSTMNEINTASKKIADIIGTIDGIAFQTNILALNAAVEAARAGEQGRGFAVVASEVRSLAQRSAEAAREIKTLIGASVDKVASGSRLVQDAGNTMGEIVASVQRVTDIIGEISAAAAEQSSGISQINSAVTQLDQMTQQNAALVEESAAAADSLQQQSRRLADTVATFRTGGESMDAHPGAHAAAPAHKVAAQATIRQARGSGAAEASAPVRRASRSAMPANPPGATPATPATATTATTATTAAAGADADWESF